MYKPIIIAIVGESGAGKTTISNYLEKKYQISPIYSYTDRKRRYPGEKGHKFVSKEVYDGFKLEDMVAPTNFGGTRYCCLKQDIGKINSYVIDEDGVDYLVKNFSKDYNIFKLRVFRDTELRLESMVKMERITRDTGRFKKRPREYDYVIVNNKDFDYLYKKIDDAMMKHINVKLLPLNYGNDR